MRRIALALFLILASIAPASAQSVDANDVRELVYWMRVHTGIVEGPVTITYPNATAKFKTVVKYDVKSDGSGKLTIESSQLISRRVTVMKGTKVDSVQVFVTYVDEKANGITKAPTLHLKKRPPWVKESDLRQSPLQNQLMYAALIRGLIMELSSDHPI